MSEVALFAVVIGWLVSSLSYFWLAAFALRDSAGQAALCLLLPPYAVFWAQRKGHRAQWIWIGGMFLFVLGFAIL